MAKRLNAILLCAGGSSRMDGVDKIFAPLCGEPVVMHTARAFAKCEFTTEIIIVTRAESVEKMRELFKGFPIPVTVVEGGATRQESALKGAFAADKNYVMISDGARPLVRPDDITRACKAAFRWGSAALAVPVTDTLKRTESCTDRSGLWNKQSFETVDRTDLWRVQTPQVFCRGEYITLAREALRAGLEFTDDSAIYEYYGKKVPMVKGSVDNIKITVKEDLELAERLLSRTPRVGHGYDVHKLVKGRELWLCGEKIDFELGLDGHSDADVALHALMDAMLGAAAMGDIGKLFPDTDDRYKGASSLDLLREVTARVTEKYTLVNCDITVLAQKPKLAPYIDKMRENIADTLGIPLDCVSVKATTEEGLGFTGSLEGIAAHAVCVIK